MDEITIEMFKDKERKNLFATYNHIEMVMVEEDHAVFRLNIKPESKNSYGMVHGGAIYAMADNATGFVYDADSGTYKMLHADGTPQLDANNSQQAGFDNLLILFSASSLRDDGLTLDYDLSMGGGVWLNGGHLWTITWTQGRDNTLLLYDADGRTMNIEAGTSYIALVTSLTGQELTVTNSSGEEILG